MVRDISMAPSGKKKIEWVQSSMPVLTAIEKEFRKTQPFRGLKIAISIHLEAKTANLALTLRAGGADVWVTGCNPLSTHDDVAAALEEMGFPVFAWRCCTDEEYEDFLCRTLSCHPDLILDDGGDLLSMLHGKCSDCGDRLMGGTEETTTGVMRMRQREAAGQLKYPMMAVNDADCKHLFDNRYGTGQSTWDAITNTTNLIVAGKTVVVAGYGWCGKGVAARAKGLGAEVIVTEIDPICAIEAVMDGHRVMKMDDAAPLGDFFVTVTGCYDVITERHFKMMKDGAVLSNSGHFDVEVSRSDLEKMATEIFERRFNIMGYRMPDGRVLNLLAEGRLVNLAAGNGHPAEIMDMSFAIQAYALEYMAKNAKGMTPHVFDVPRDIDMKVAAMKLTGMGVSIDALTEQQKEYLGNY